MLFNVDDAFDRASGGTPETRLRAMAYMDRVLDLANQ